MKVDHSMLQEQISMTYYNTSVVCLFVFSLVTHVQDELHRGLAPQSYSGAQIDRAPRSFAATSKNQCKSSWITVPGDKKAWKIDACS